MKTILFLSVLAVSLGVARAQDATYDADTYSTDAYAAPAVVYNAPVTYAAPVVYQAPVVYYAPVFYGTPVSSALNACAACQDTAVRACQNTLASRSTVTYIGGGQTRFQVAPRCNTGSTVTYIGGSWFASH